MQGATTLATEQRRRDPARILCAFSRHRASSRIILNDGYHFSRCLRCNADLVEVEGGWSAAPRGYRIVWKSEPKEVPAPAEEEPVVLHIAAAEPVARDGEAAVGADEELTLVLNGSEAIGADQEAAVAVEPASEETAEPVYPERRRLDRRVNPYAFAYKGKERRRNRDRRNNFGRKTDAV